MSMTWHFELTEKSVNKTGNTSVVNAKLWVSVTSANEGSTQYKSYTLTIDGKSYTGQAQTNPTLAYPNTYTVVSKDVTVTHNDDGSKTCSASVDYDSPWGRIQKSAKITLTKIARASTLTVSNGTLGTEQTINMKKANSAYLHTLYYKVAGDSTTHTLLTASSATTCNVTFPVSYAQYAPSASSVSITVYLKTVDSSGNQIGTVQSSTISQAIPASVKPSCTVTMTEASGQSHVSKYGGLVSGKSAVDITCAFTGAYGSTLASKSITIGDTTYTSDVTSHTVTGTGSKTATCTVKDSRGSSSERATSNEMTVLPYTEPAAIKLDVARVNAEHEEDDSGVYVRYTISYSITALGDGNSKNISLQYKQANGTTWSSVSIPVDAYTGSDVIGFTGVQFDSNRSYDMRLLVQDDFRTSYISATLATAECLIDAYVDGDNIALTIGGAAEKTGLVSKIPAEFEGTVTLDVEPTEDSHAATKKYVDDSEATAKSYTDGKVAGLFSPEMTYVSPDGVSVASGSWKTVAEVSVVTGGIYVMQGFARFASNATGYRAVAIAKAQNADSEDGLADKTIVRAVSGEQTMISAVTVKTATQNKYYINAYQNSGSALTVTGRFRICRIK